MASEEKTDALREAFAAYADKPVEEVGAFAIVFESQTGDASSIHTVWSDVAFVHITGMLRELEWQIAQTRMRNEAKQQIAELMGNESDGQV